jgi:hypothetical protein
MSIDRNTDLGERRVYEGPEADVTLVKLALEREGIRTAVHSTYTVRTRLRGAVYVVDAGDLERARALVAGYVDGKDVGGTTLSRSWRCANCGESIEEQFEACWRCGTPKPN